MLETARRTGRALLRAWGCWGKAPGWHYRAVERWGAKLSASDLVPSVLANGCRMDCDLDDEVQRQIYFLGAYEPVEAYLFMELLGPGMTVIDAGANVGQYTLLASSAVGPTGAVYSFEPVPATFSRLRAHVRNNQLGNVHLERAALWHEPTNLRLGLSAEMLENSGAYSIGVNNPATAVETRAMRLDDFAVERGIKRVDFIKMDIEGAELFALQGMSSILSHNRPILLVEVNRCACDRLGYRCADLWGLLVGDFGYRAWAIGHTHHVCRALTSLDEIGQQNVLFHVADLPPAVINGWDLKSVLRWARRLAPARGPQFKASSVAGWRGPRPTPKE